MRLTVMRPMAKSINTNDRANLNAEVEKELERLKWNLWHGNVHKALQIVDDLEFALDIEDHGQEKRKLLKAVGEFGTYISANRTFIPNYGDRYRHGETISTAFVESAINQVLSKRFKRQQMRWTERGAHLLVVDPSFEWSEARSHKRIPWDDTIIYEMHVRGFTKQFPKMKEQLQATFAGLGQKEVVDYIRSLGVTSVELLPIHAFVNDSHLLEKGVTNYW